MKINLMEVDKFVTVNSCPEVTSPIIFDSTGYPNDDGILSYELFGISGSYDRKTIYGYIDLKKRFLHPVAFKALVSTKKLYEAVINGSGYFKIVDGDIVEDPNSGNNGLEWLYKNWDKINIKSNGSPVREANKKILSLPKEKLFISKWIVIPAFYRDVDISKKGKKAVDEVNQFYTKLINLSSSGDATFNFMGRMTEYRIQMQLNEIFAYLTNDTLSGKEGMIKQSLMGKISCSFKTFLIAGNSKQVML